MLSLMLQGEVVQGETGGGEGSVDYGELATQFATTYGPKVVGAFIFLIVGWILTKFLTGLLRKILRQSNVDATLTGFLCNLTKMALLTLVVIAVIGKLGVPTASFVAVLGAAGFAVGFALQGSLSNFAAGVMIMIFRPFKKGDYVEAGGTSGTVDEVAIFATTFRTGDNKMIIVANNAITSGNITNYSAHDTRRVDMVFGIGYGDDVKKAKQILASLLEKDGRALEDPAPTIAVSELAESSVNIICRPWVKSGDYWDLLLYMNEAVMLEFEAQGISIPFPQQDVHMHQVA